MRRGTGGTSRAGWRAAGRAGAVTLAAALWLSGSATAGPQSIDPNTATFGFGHSVFASIAVNPAILRAEGHIPARWKLALDPKGQASLLLIMTSAPISLSGETRPMTVTQLFAVLDSSALPAPERQLDTSDYEGSPEDLYYVSLSVNDRALAQWLRAGPGLGRIVHYAPGLSFDLGPGPLSSFRFSAPAPSPTPLQFSATLTPAFFPVTPAVSDFWRETPVGTFRLEDRSTEFLDQVPSWHLTTDPGSLLGRLLGGGRRDFTCGPDTLPAPILGVVSHQNNTGCIGGETFTKVVWTKQIVGHHGRRPAVAPGLPGVQSVRSRARSLAAK